ncbi:MAG: M20/M25/M40 family metallo-hydrolase [Planctomycetota bacterium]
MHRTLFGLLTLAATAAPTLAQGDPDVIAKILDEGKNRSQVWQTLTYISQEIGPRLTGSAGLERANVWTRDQFTKYGLSNSHMQRWGDIPVRFDRGPCSAKMVAPMEREFEFTTSAWGPGTDGPVRGKVVKMPTTMEELESQREALNGAWVLAKSQQRSRRGQDREEAQAQAELRRELDAALKEIQILGKITAGTRDEVTTGGVRGWRELTMDTLPTELELQVRRADYDAMNSRLSDGETVEVEADLKHYFTEGPIPVYNTIAEIKGTEFPDEVVIISAHLDSWNGPGSQGTQDNGTGSSVTLEAARILAAVGAKPRRTIRFCLWSGEEQGLLGSRGYVESLSDEELSKISAAFVDDGGTYYQGGLECIESMRPMLEAATAPLAAAFPDLPITHQVGERMPRGGSSDHASFNRKGVPGFFWIEKNRPGLEGMGYRFSWHTQKDTLEYAIEEYLVQSATCSAVTAYNLAMADTLLPREEPAAAGEEPEGRPRRGGDAGAAESRPVPRNADGARREGAEPAAGNDAFVAVDSPISGKWLAEFTTAGIDFDLAFQADAKGAVQGTMIMGDTPRKLENGKWDAATKSLTFEYESGTYGRLTSKATLQDDGSLKGDVKSSPESEGYPWTAKKATPPKNDGV